MNTFSTPLAQFESLLAARAGLQVRAQDRVWVEQTIGARAQSRQMQLAQYLGFLQSTASEEEWKLLFALLTNQESYFFRDEGQFALLREHILPELIAAKRARRTLKLWSAGCSTGEEPYSLAMTLDTLMPFRDDWNVEIWATDLSEKALQKAQAGTFGAWSFRNTPAETRDRYFQKHKDDWILDERLCKSVRFRQGNLLEDNFIARGIFDVDLIFCRNVFIYFRREAVAQVARKLRNSLRDGGYLVTGHAELHDVALPDLEARTFAQSVVYQRTSTRSASSSHLPTFEMPTFEIPPLPPQNTEFSTPTSFSQTHPSMSQSSLAQSPSVQSELDRFSISRPIPHDINRIDTKLFPTTELPSRTTEPGTAKDELEIVQRAHAILREGRSEAALQQLETLLHHGSDAIKNTEARFGAHCLVAQALANEARYDEALLHCACALEIDALSPLPYSLQARIAEEVGEGARAKELLKKVVYLAPRSVPAMMELSALYQQEGDARRAESWREAALRALVEYSNHDTLPSHLWSLDEAQCAGELRQHLTQSSVTKSSEPT